MSQGPSILKNSAWNGIASVVGMLLLLVTTPIYLKILGPDRFGLYMLLVAVIAPFEVLNAGVSQATVKHLAAWLPDGRLLESAAMMRIGLLFNWSAGIISIFGLWIAAPWLANSVFKISEGLRNDAIVSFRMAAPLWLTIQIVGSLGSVVVAEQNFRLCSVVQMIRSVITYLGGIPILILFGSVASLQAWSILTYLPVLLVWAVVVSKRLGPRAILPGFCRTAFQQSFRFSFWQMLNAISNMISLQADRVLLGAILGTAAVGAYGIAASIQMRAATLVWSSFATLFPAVSKNSQKNPQKSETDVMQKGGMLSLIACLAYAIGFWFAGPFCKIWLGSTQDSDVIAYLLQMLFLVAIVAIPSAQIMQYLLGHGLTRLIFVGNIGMAFSVALCSFILISHFGVKGAAVGAFVGLIVSRLPLHIWVTWKLMASGTSGLSRIWSLYRIPCIFAVILGVSLFLPDEVLLRNDFSTKGLFFLLAAFLFSTTISLFLAYFFGAKEILFDIYKRLRRLLPIT